MTKELMPKEKVTDFLIYTTSEGNVKVEAFLHNENVWLTQDKMADLFGVQRPAITKHLIHIFESKELEENSVSSILEHTASDGKKYKTKYYNLDAIISVGYRVNSKQATLFRIWATKVVKEYVLKGFDWTGIYTEVKEYERIEYDMEDGRHVKITFTQVPQGTKVTESFETENIHTEEQQREGWQAILNNFKKYTEK
ncbi:MAG: hypothetical protein QT08_C0007G0008 [archaeon GW2011_AR17]|nr:MAG: hypothetical protein QT08_C0007G0008 [archaeon GW2011_AR17]MBS3153676.1 virulence RhuM family protein [Candidatus Woesearchaeota archaeon]HIH15093.1 hypothetical protein [Nanoarchaeota archaeon]HIH58748.1 hypothetical protein [Nanoarchaeota archaeon]HII13655.1 hypothetical protein [Nanoarchaeota archaeon]